jgi:glycosyltransferase involved in cell wall biosynthesis
LAAAYPGVRFRGELGHGQTLQLLSRCGVFVSTSEEETQGLALLEAAALEMPLVVTDLPPYVGIWQHGHNCLVSPVGDVPALQANVQSLLTDPALAASLGQAAALTAQRFEWAGFASRMQAVLAGLSER